MPKEEWGVKRVCPKCAVRFYDLQRDPMTCPSCEASFDLASLTQQKARTIAPEKEKVVAAPVADEMTETDPVLDDEEAGDANLGDDVLDDDEDDTVALEEIADVPASDDES